MPAYSEFLVTPHNVIFLTMCNEINDEIKTADNALSSYLIHITAGVFEFRWPGGIPANTQANMTALGLTGDTLRWPITGRADTMLGGAYLRVNPGTNVVARAVVPGSSFACMMPRDRTWLEAIMSSSVVDILLAEQWQGGVNWNLSILNERKVDPATMTLLPPSAEFTPATLSQVAQDMVARDIALGRG